ncbi:MAG: hypothetical protein IIA35_05315 [Proteobacteria bacterium]|nr:hypothetical protein [Pseudomonadota bacterium]
MKTYIDPLASARWQARTRARGEARKAKRADARARRLREEASPVMGSSV